MLLDQPYSVTAIFVIAQALDLIFTGLIFPQYSVHTGTQSSFNAYFMFSCVFSSEDSDAPVAKHPAVTSQTTPLSSIPQPLVSSHVAAEPSTE